LLEPGFEFLSDEPRHHVGAGAGRKADDQLHRPIGVGLGERERMRHQCEAGGKQTAACESHHGLVSLASAPVYAAL
jgi:hypothetical protein